MSLSTFGGSVDVDTVSSSISSALQISAGERIQCDGCDSVMFDLLEKRRTLNKAENNIHFNMYNRCVDVR